MPAQHVIDVFVGEPGYQGLGVLGYLYLSPVLVVVDGRGDYVLGDIQGMILVEFYVFGIGHLGLGRSGDDIGMDAVGYLPHTLVDTLHIHHHGFHRSCEQCQLLLQYVSRNGHAVAHQYLVGRAADPPEVDSLGSGLLRLLLHLRQAGGQNDHLREQGLVAVYDYVDLVLLDNSEIDLGLQGGGGIEHDVLQLRPDHGASPAVGQGRAGRAFEDVLVFLVHTDMGAVHELHHLAVDAAGEDAELAPYLLALLRRPLGEGQLALLLAEHGQAALAHFQGDFVYLAVADLDI